MDNYRKIIDNIDEQIMKLLEERLLLVKDVGLYKRQNNICELATRTINQNMTFSETGTYELEVIIPRWQINAGTYDVNFMINKHTLLFDWIKSAINFEVKFGDFYGTNRLPDAERMILMDYKWECKKL